MAANISMVLSQPLQTAKLLMSSANLFQFYTLLKGFNIQLMTISIMYVSFFSTYLIYTA